MSFQALQVHTDVESSSEDYHSDAIPVPVIAPSLPRLAVSVLVGLGAVVGVAVILRGATSAPVAQMKPSAVLQAEAWGMPPECAIDPDASEEVNYAPMVCMRYTDPASRLVYHSSMSDPESCETAKTSPTHSDVTCCKTNRCDGKLEKEDVTCFVDGTFGGLTKVSYIRDPFAMGMLCSKYVLNDGSIGHQPMGKETCDSMRKTFDNKETWAGGTKWYTEVLCCTEDECNGDGMVSDKVKVLTGNLNVMPDFFRRIR